MRIIKDLDVALALVVLVVGFLPHGDHLGNVVTVLIAVTLATKKGN